MFGLAEILNVILLDRKHKTLLLAVFGKQTILSNTSSSFTPQSRLTKNNWHITVRNMTSGYVTVTSLALFVNNTSEHLKHHTCL
jgi:P pilus assembly chaperone PapD